MVPPSPIQTPPSGSSPSDSDVIAGKTIVARKMPHFINAYPRQSVERAGPYVAGAILHHGERAIGRKSFFFGERRKAAVAQPDQSAAERADPQVAGTVFVQRQQAQIVEALFGGRFVQQMLPAAEQSVRIAGKPDITVAVLVDIADVDVPGNALRPPGFEAIANTAENAGAVTEQPHFACRGS